MKHCVKKLLGLAFALALCLAVGGTALAAEAPEFADVPAALPEQEMLDYEPNVTAEPGNTTTGDIATDGYTVTIPTTVDVKSGENKDELKVTAVMKQWRTLEIDIASYNNWKLKYQGDAAGTTTPEVGYTLENTEVGGHTSQGMIWTYDATNHKIAYTTTRLTAVDKAEIPLSVNVTDPSQATMSGTYSDTLAFDFKITKQSVTYTINVYGQNITTKPDGRADVESVVEPGTTTNEITRTEGTVDSGKVKENTYTETYTMEYGFATGNLVGEAPGPWTHTQPEAGDTRTSIKNTVTTFTAESAADYKRCWETLSQQTIDPQTDYANGIRNVTINLNLVRKWYWLDVNGATDYTGGDEASGGNQGNKIAGFVDMRVSVDGDNWSDWFYQPGGDDYWGQFPYGIHFKLGFHHVKNGYVYDTQGGTLSENGFRIIANNVDTHTTYSELSSDKKTTYYVYEGTLTGTWTDTVEGNKNRYCYIPCYKKGITYFANGGTGGTESVNTGNLPRSNVLYDETGTLESPDQLQITPPSADMIFAGWSTKRNYTTENDLYTTAQTVADVTWEPYTDTGNRPQLNGVLDTQKRELYAIWKYPCTVKVQFGGDRGWTTWDETSQTFPENMQDGDIFDTAIELGTAYAYRNASLTVSATENTAVWNALQNAINAETSKIAGAAQPEKVWQLKTEYTFNSTSPEFTIQIKRKRYLLNVIPALLQSDGSSITPAGDGSQAAQYGKFDLESCGRPQSLEGKFSYYQWMRNYGGSYRIYKVEANPGYQFAFFRVIESNAPVNKEGSSYNSTLTGKNFDISYFGGDNTTYEGDTIYVVFKEVTTNPGSTTPMPGPSLAPAKKALTLRYHANFDPNEELALDLDPDPLLEDMDDTFGFDPDPLPEDVLDPTVEAVKTVTYKPGEDVVLRNCMFKRGGYVFVGWNTEPDGTGKGYEVNGVPITDWAAGDTVDLYAQWKKPEHLKPVVDSEPFVPADPDTPPERVDDGFDADFGADPDPLPEGMDDAFGVDPAVQPEELDDAFGVDPDPLPEALDDAFGV